MPKEKHASIADDQLKPPGFHALMGCHASKMLMSALGYSRSS
jgi:hypothetical protein